MSQKDFAPTGIKFLSSENRLYQDKQIFFLDLFSFISEMFSEVYNELHCHCEPVFSVIRRNTVHLQVFLFISVICLFAYKGKPNKINPLINNYVSVIVTVLAHRGQMYYTVSRSRKGLQYLSLGLRDMKRVAFCQLAYTTVLQSDY